MLKAYFDESGVHQGAQACVVAGFWGKIGPWRKFEKGWRSVLKNFKLPLEQFHAKEIAQRNGIFHRWDHEKYGDFLKRIGSVVRESRIRPVCHGVFHEDFYSFSLPERRFLTGAAWNPETRKFLTSGSPNKPYFIAFTECIKTVAGYTLATGKVEMFFGSDRPIAEYATHLMKWLKWRTGQQRSAGARINSRFSIDKFGGMHFPLAKETPRLQVADLFSYLTYIRMLEGQKTRDFDAVPNELMSALLSNRKELNDTTYRDAELLRNMISELQIPPGN